MPITFELIQNKNMLVDILSWTIPFLLGLFASLIIDSLRRSKKNKSNKTFIKQYLSETLKPTLFKLEKAYKVMKERIKTNKVGHFQILAFENFNTKVLNAFQPMEYYEIFKDQYTLMDEIINMIDFIRDDLPIKISNDYWKYIDEHLKLNDAIGDYGHIETCDICINFKKGVEKNFDARIKETKEIIEKLEIITK